MPAPTSSTQSPVQLHRARFLDQTPSPITALSFAPIPLPPPSPTSDKGKGKSRNYPDQPEELGPLVLARENGNVEIWKWAREDGGVGNWILEKILPPTLTHPTISLMVLVIRNVSDFHEKTYAVPRIEDSRLFTAGSESTELVERCLATGRILSLTPIPSAPIWSMTVSPTHQLLCLSTTAPTLSFLSIPPSGPLETPPAHLLRCDAVPSRTRTVSIAWAPPKVVQNDGEDIWADTYLITGHSDSSFRKWELPLPTELGRPGIRVSLRARAVVEKVQKSGRGGKKVHGSQKGTIVWGVAVLPDHTIVTSDSLGSVTFWDGASLAQKQSFSAHKADGMCMVVGPSGRTVFTAGPDQRVCQFTCISNPNAASRWVQSGFKRIHSHDIRALAIFPPYTPFAKPINPHLAPVIASGGWDMSVSFTPAASSDLLVNTVKNPLSKSTGMSRVVFDEAFSRKMSYSGGGRSTGSLSVSRKGRLVVSRSDRGVGIWRVLDEEQGWEKLLDMELRLRTNLVSSAVSDDGDWLALSDLYETKLFRLEHTPAGGLAAHRVKTFLQTLEDSESLSHLSLQTTGTGSSALLFTPDSQRLIMALTGQQLLVIALPRGEEDVRVMECFAPLESAEGGRVIVQGRLSRRKEKALKRAANGHANGEDVEMEDASAPNGVNGEANGHSAEKEKDDDEDDSTTRLSDNKVSTPGAWRVCLAASEDGQWLASSDLLGRVAIYNLDTLRLHAILPTLPVSPSAIAFPPAHPSLLAILTPTGSLQFCHLEHRRLLPPTTQIETLNTALSTQFTPVQSISFEPSRDNVRASRCIIWSHDWICSAQLDLELIGRLAGKKGNASLRGIADDAPVNARRERKKRAREARDALAEMVSLSGSSDVPSTPMSSVGSMNGSVGPAGMSSAKDPNFHKIQGDRYRGVVGVDWFGEGEMVLVERPFGDFVGELPQAFWTGTFGRA